MRGIAILAALLAVLAAGCGSEPVREERSRSSSPAAVAASSGAASAPVPTPHPGLSSSEPAPGGSMDWDAAGREALETLKELVRHSTHVPDATSEGSRTLELATALAERFRGEGIAAEVIPGTAPGRGNLVARLKGDGSKRPLLMLAHIDTVAWEREKWDTDPLEGVVKEDGYFYGRGAIDDKGMAAVEIATMLRLARNQRLSASAPDGATADNHGSGQARLTRDVILLLECDEEIGGPSGMNLVVEKHWDKIDAEYAINEGGKILIREDGSFEYVGVQSAEKTPYNILLTAKGTAGHGSVPLPDNPVLTIGRALARISAHRTPVTLNETTRRFFAGLGKLEPDPVQAKIFANLVSADAAASAGAAAYLARKNPMYGSMLRNSIAPTVLTGGTIRNAIPSEASVNLNCRLLPGEDVKAFLEELRQVVNEPSVTFDVKSGMASGEAPASPLDTELWRAIEAETEAMAPGTPVLSYMSTGATDSVDLRRRGVVTYGIMPAPITEEDLRRFHGHNERVRVSSLKFGVEFLYRVVMRMAGS